MQREPTPVREAMVFFAITIGLSYVAFWGPLALLQTQTINFVTKEVGPVWAIGLFVLGGFVPSLAGIVLTVVYEGVPGLRRLGKRVVTFRIGWRWYVAAVIVVVAATAAQVAVTSLLGPPFDLGLFVAQLGSLVPLIVLGPLSEELGWRGFALDRVQTRFNALASSLIVGAVWAAWHLPLFFMAGTSQNVLDIPFLGFAVGVIGLSVLFTWLHNNTSGSVWTAVFFHWIYTYGAQVAATGAHRSALYNWVEYTPYVVAAVIVVLVWGPRSLTRGATPDAARAP